MEPRTVILSSEPADADRRLWYFLRNSRLAGHKFRRNHPIGPYIVEFACIEQRLIVEIDGGRRAATDGELDDERKLSLDALGYRVLRFRSEDVLGRMAQVIAGIYAALDADLGGAGGRKSRAAARKPRRGRPSLRAARNPTEI